MSFRITYSVLDADLTELHREFDSALKSVTDNLGDEFPYWTHGKAGTSGQWIEDRNPANTDQVLARFHKTPVAELDAVMETAHRASRQWRQVPWQDRIKVFRKAADLIGERRLEMSAIMSLEVGKNRLESLGEVEETADLFRWNADQMEEANGFIRKMGKLAPNENVTDRLRPYGAFAVISPFNFPTALAGGMGSGAMLGGNAVVWKPSEETPWTAHKMYEVLRDAGLPDGLFQVVHGLGEELGEALVSHPRTSGIAFTGSYDVGMHIYRKVAHGPHPKPVLLEMGGKNAAIVCESADLEKAISGCWKAAFGLTGQKCSALSRVYVHPKVKDAFLKGLVEATREIKIGDPTDADVYLGPLNNEQGLGKHLAALADAKREGNVLVGGEDLRTQSKFAKGYFAQPTVAELPTDHRLFRDELFSPFLAVQEVSDLEQGVAEANKTVQGLTGGIYTENKDELNYFWDHMESGVLYANRASGATTGAWPGVNSFCGWKGSGGSGRGICGPYYTGQFVREQSLTLME